MKKITLAFLVLLMISVHAMAQSPKIIAHRGAWKNTKAPQNSIASLKAAIEQKVWGTEFDVHLTRDSVLVVNHDNDFYGLDIATSTYQELLTKKHPNGESIPTAEEYLTAGLKQKKTKLIYELKTNRISKQNTLNSVDMSYELVKKLKGFSKVEFIAFDYDACVRFRELDPEVKIHYLNGDKTPEEIKSAKLSGIDYSNRVFKNHPDWVKKCADLGLKTNVWTVNTVEDMQYYVGLKTDFITTDEPELLKKTLNPAK